MPQGHKSIIIGAMTADVFIIAITTDNLVCYLSYSTARWGIGAASRFELAV